MPGFTARETRAGTTMLLDLKAEEFCCAGGDYVGVGAGGAQDFVCVRTSHIRGPDDSVLPRAPVEDEVGRVVDLKAYGGLNWNGVRGIQLRSWDRSESDC